MYRIKIAKYTSQKADRKKSDDTWYYKFQKPGYNKNGGRLYAYKAGFPTKAAAEEAAEKEYLAIYGETSGTDNVTNIDSQTYRDIVSDLSMVSTAQLVKELSKREAVQKLNIEPYQSYKIKIGRRRIAGTGPVVILRVCD